MLRCEPSFDGIEELVHELNKTDGLFKFVRVMRKKFQEALVQGINVCFYLLNECMHVMWELCILETEKTA